MSFDELLYHDNWLEHEEDLRAQAEDLTNEMRDEINKEIEEDRIRFVNLL